MKKFLLIFIFVIINFFSFSQKFDALSGLPVDIDNGSVNYTSCSSPGNKTNIKFTVTGLPNLSSTFTLASIDLKFDASCGGGLSKIWLYIKSPNGICYQFYYGDFSSNNMDASPDNKNVNITLRDGSCLVYPDFTSSWLLNKTVSGNYGVFKAGDPTTNQPMSVVFNNINPNGDWYIYAWDNAVNAPCITSASILFANPTVGNKLSEGESCEDPIVWNGEPICAQTNGKTGSSQMPGSIGGNGTTSFGKINNVTCSWNAANNNDVWIKFTPKISGTVCIGISSLSNQLQSIVVTDMNVDGDNKPCTQNAKTSTNDPNWMVVSCPQTFPTYSNGSMANQQHCFLGEQNKTYYLVVDGNGGNESPFYLSGVSGLPSVLSFEEDRYIENIREEQDNSVTLENGFLITEMKNNSTQREKIIIFDPSGKLLYNNIVTFKKYLSLDLNRYMKSGMNYVKVIIDNKTQDQFVFKVLK